MRMLFFRIFFFFFRFLPRDEDFIDAEVVHIHDFKGKFVPDVRIRFLRNAAYAVGDEAGQGLVQVVFFAGQVIFQIEEIPP